jgi:hypothetical protein
LHIDKEEEKYIGKADKSGKSRKPSYSKGVIKNVSSCVNVVRVCASAPRLNRLHQEQRSG